MPTDIGGGKASLPGFRIARVRIHKLVGKLTQRFGW
jgi:hypothetical protein